MQPHRPPQRLSTRIYLLGLVAAVVVPLLAFATFLLTWLATAERARFERDALQTARQVALVIDGELHGLVALLRGLASSSSLARGDYAQFHIEATRLIDGTDNIVVLREYGPRQILNTQRPYGTPLPPAVPMSPREQQSFAENQPIVSNVYKSPISGEVRIAVAVPVVLEGGVKYILAITVRTSRIRDTLLPAVPPGWIVGVGDEDGTYVTRSARHAEITGTPGVPEYLAQAVGRSGTFTSFNWEGVALLAGYHRSEFSNWLIGANIPQAEFEAPLWRSIAALAVLGTAALALSALMAYLFGNTFTAASAGLAERAEALGRGRPVPPMPSRLAEFALVGDALAAAAAAIHERTHELETVLATVPAAVWFTYDREGRHLVPNQFAAELLRIPKSDAAGLRNTSLGHVQFLKEKRSLRPGEMPLQRAMRGERVEDEEYTCLFADGTSCTLLTSATALRDEMGSIVGAVSVSLDITERERVEQQRRLLINELNHRVKNTLATVQSIAQQTLRSATSTERARESLVDRLIALAEAHDILTHESWEGADLHDIVAGATGPHGGRERFSISGPSVWLTPSMSLSLSLALHELATNAAKYGALSNASGSVTVSWELADAGGAPGLRLRWIERGGPPVAAPDRQGFGSKLIQRSLSAEVGGTVVVDYAPDGLVCVMEMQLPAPPRVV